MSESKFVTEKIESVYRVKMSMGFDVLIEEEELPVAIAIWKSGDIGKFKQGLVKGSFIAGILQDTDKCIIRENNRRPGHSYSPEFKPLQDIFKGVDLKQLTDKKLLS